MSLVETDENKMKLFTIDILTFFEGHIKQAMITSQGMAKHKFSNVFNYQSYTLLWYLC